MDESLCWSCAKECISKDVVLVCNKHMTYHELKEFPEIITPSVKIKPFQNIEDIAERAIHILYLANFTTDEVSSLLHMRRSTVHRKATKLFMQKNIPSAGVSDSGA